MNTYVNTTLVDCNRASSEEAKGGNNTHPATWINKVGTGLKINAGDKISVASSFVSEPGCGAGVIEFQGKSTGGYYSLKDTPRTLSDPAFPFETGDAPPLPYGDLQPYNHHIVKHIQGTTEYEIKDNEVNLEISYYKTANGEGYFFLPRRWDSTYLAPDYDNTLEGEGISADGMGTAFFGGNKYTNLYLNYGGDFKGSPPAVNPGSHADLGGARPSGGISSTLPNEWKTLTGYDPSGQVCIMDSSTANYEYTSAELEEWGGYPGYDCAKNGRAWCSPWREKQVPNDWYYYDGDEYVSNADIHELSAGIIKSEFYPNPWTGSIWKQRNDNSRYTIYAKEICLYSHHKNNEPLTRFQYDGYLDYTWGWTEIFYPWGINFVAPGNTNAPRTQVSANTTQRTGVATPPRTPQENWVNLDTLHDQYGDTSNGWDGVKGNDIYGSRDDFGQTDLDAEDDSFEGTSIRDPALTGYIKYTEIKNLKVDAGFNSPSDVAQTLTNQLNQSETPQEIYGWSGTWLSSADVIGPDGHIIPTAEEDSLANGFVQKQGKISVRQNSECYKTFGCANFDSFSEETYNQYIANDYWDNESDLEKARLVQHLSNYQYIGVKRPELFEAFRDFHKNTWSSRQDEMGMSAITDDSQYFSWRNLHHGQIKNTIAYDLADPTTIITTNYKWTTSNLEGFYDVFKVQGKYPELFNDYNEEGEESLSSDVYRFVHMNVYDGLNGDDRSLFDVGTNMMGMELGSDNSFVKPLIWTGTNPTANKWHYSPCEDRSSSPLFIDFQKAREDNPKGGTSVGELAYGTMYNDDGNIAFICSSGIPQRLFSPLGQRVTIKWTFASGTYPGGNAQPASKWNYNPYRLSSGMWGAWTEFENPDPFPAEVIVYNTIIVDEYWELYVIPGADVGGTNANTYWTLYEGEIDAGNVDSAVLIAGGPGAPYGSETPSYGGFLTSARFTFGDQATAITRGYPATPQFEEIPSEKIITYQNAGVPTLEPGSGLGRGIGFDIHFSSYGTLAIGLYSGFLNSDREQVQQFKMEQSGNPAVNLYKPKVVSNQLRERYIGASSPLISFDALGERFNFQQLHTPLYNGNLWNAGNGVVPINTDAGDESLYLNRRLVGNEFCPEMMPYAHQIQTHGTGSGDNVLIDTGNKNVFPWSVFDSDGGIFLEDFGIDESDWDKSLWGIMGFTYSQFHSTGATYDRQTRINNVVSTDTMGKPTTNADVEGSDVIQYRTNQFGASIYSSQVPCVLFDKFSVKAHDLTATAEPILPVVSIKQTSAQISAEKLPTKMARPYYLIKSNIVGDLGYIGGIDSGQTLPIVAVVNKENGFGDFYFAGQSEVIFTATHPRTITEVVTGVFNPDMSEAEVGDDSGVIYKIDKMVSNDLNVAQTILKKNKPKDK